MNYWWVNHKQTFRQEFDGGYVWCPKRKQDGNRNHFYETMRIVQRGDLILSYANASVQGYGLAQTHCYSCPRPDDFGRIGETWDKSGWRVDVGFKRFTQSFGQQITPTLSLPYYLRNIRLFKKVVSVIKARIFHRFQKSLLTLFCK